MSIRYEREEEFLASAFKRVGGGLRDVQRATGTERAQTMETVIEMVPVVADALEKAQQAINDAADAVTTSNGKNARRRGKTEPAPPGGGWVAGDQWIVDNDDGDPVEVRVWDGTEFVHEQLLAAELLILSGGVIRLADGTVTADALVADAIDGMTITGALIRTAASGQRMQLDINGLRAFDSGNVQRALLAASSGGLLLSGTLTSYTGGNTQRAVLSNGALTFDYVGSPGAGTMTLGPDGITSTDADSRFKILKTSSAAGVGIDIIAGSGSYETGINIHPALKKISLFAESVEFQGGELSTDVSVNLASILSLASGTSIDGSSWLRKRSDGIVYGTLAFYRAAGFTSGATFATLAADYRPIGGDQLPAVMWGAGAPGRAHFQMGGAANGVLIVWSPPASTQYVSAKVMYRTS